MCTSFGLAVFQWNLTFCVPIYVYILQRSAQPKRPRKHGRRWGRGRWSWLACQKDSKTLSNQRTRSPTCPRVLWDCHSEECIKLSIWELNKRLILTNLLGFQLLFKSLQTPCREPLQGRPILEPMREDSNNRDRPTDRVPKSDRKRPIGAEIHSLKQSIVMEDHESGVSSPPVW